MHEDHSKLFLAVTAGFRRCRVQGSRLHVALNVKGVLFDKGSALGAGHGENALENGQQGVLIHVLPVIGNLRSNIVHEVNAASDVIGKISFHPALGTTDHDNTALKGLGAGGGDVGLAVVVDSIAVKQAALRDTRIAGAVLGGENLTDVRIAGQHLRLAHFIEAGARNTINRILERLRIEALSVKFSVRHSKIFLS